MTDAIIVKASSRSNTIFQRYVAKDTHPNAGGGGVANAHLAQTQHATTFSGTAVDQVGTNLDGAVELLLRHRWLVEKVSGATGYLLVNNALYARQVVIHTHIDDAEMEVVLTAEHVHTTTTTGEINHLLPRHFARGHTDSLAFYPMIAT